MPTYNFNLKLKQELGLFHKFTFVNDIKESCTNYNQFVFGMNIKKVKSVNIDGLNVKISLNLINKISDNDFDDAIKYVIKLMKKKGYSLKKENSKKLNTNTKKMKKKIIKKSIINKTRKTKH